jgi:hypothetical protein
VLSHKFFLLLQDLIFFLLGLLLLDLILPMEQGMNRNLQMKRLSKFFLLPLNFLKKNFHMEMHLQKYAK